MFQAAFSPGNYFSRETPGLERKEVIRGFFIFAALSALFIQLSRELSRWLTADVSQELRRQFDLPAPDPLLPPAAAFVFGLLFAILVWAGFLVGAAALRKFAAFVLGERKLTFHKSLVYSAYSALPLFLGASLAYLVQLLFTPRTVEQVMSTVAFGPAVRLFLLLAAVCWEGTVFTFAVHRREAILKRRAFLIWTAPITLLVFLALGLVLAFQIYDTFTL